MKIDKKLAGRIIAEIKSRKIDFSKKDYSLFDLVAGAKVETEHSNTVGGSVAKFVDIAMDHLDEFGNYYKGLKKMEAKLDKSAQWATALAGLRGAWGAAKPMMANAARHYGNLLFTDTGKLSRYIKDFKSPPPGQLLLPPPGMPSIAKMQSRLNQARLAQYGTAGVGLLGGGYVANKLDNMNQPQQQDFNIPGYGPYEYGMEGQAMDKYYEQGFIDKCAEHGIDPKQLIKKSSKLDSLMRAGKVSPATTVKAIEPFYSRTRPGYTDADKMKRAVEWIKRLVNYKDISRHDNQSLVDFRRVMQNRKPPTVSQ